MLTLYLKDLTNLLQVEYTNQFKRDLKLSKRRGKDIALLNAVMKQIENEEKLDINKRDPALTGNWHLHRELHIENDWLLIYRIIEDEKTVIFVRTGTHADLFE